MTSAQEILLSLDELEEETNLGFSVPKKRITGILKDASSSHYNSRRKSTRSSNHDNHINTSKSTSNHDNNNNNDDQELNYLQQLSNRGASPLPCDSSTTSSQLTSIHSNFTNATRTAAAATSTRRSDSTPEETDYDSNEVLGIMSFSTVSKEEIDDDSSTDSLGIAHFTFATTTNNNNNNNRKKNEDDRFHDYYADLQHGPVKIDKSKTTVKISKALDNSNSNRCENINVNDRHTNNSITCNKTATISPDLTSSILKTPTRNVTSTSSAISSTSKSYTSSVATSPTTSIAFTSIASPTTSTLLSQASSPLSHSVFLPSDIYNNNKNDHNDGRKSLKNDSSDDYNEVKELEEINYHDDFDVLNDTREKLLSTSPIIFEYDKYYVPSSGDSSQDGPLEPSDLVKTTEINNQNPTGMVISAPDMCFSEEAILDPTWLDSLDDHNNDEVEDIGKFIASKLKNGTIPSDTMRERSVSSNYSTSTSTSSRYCSGESLSDGQSVSSKSVSLASSLSVGSCGFGKISLGGSISLFSESDMDDSSDSELSYADVVDMGITSFEDLKGGLVCNDTDPRHSSSASNPFFTASCHDKDIQLDQLYDNMDYCDCDEDGSECELSDDHLENLDANEAKDIPTTPEEDEEENLNGAYLPQHLLPPPRLHRHHDQESSLLKPFQKEREEDKESDEDTVIYNNIHRSNNHIDVDDGSTSLSSSSVADVQTSMSPCEPCSIDTEGFSGIISGDIIISILDCPGKRTRRKRKIRSKKVDNKKNKFSAAFAKDFNWCEYSVHQTIGMIRELRNVEVEGTISSEDFEKSTVSPFDIGRSLMTSQSPSKSYMNKKKSTPFFPSSYSLENEAIAYMKINEFDKALSSFEENLSIFANELDACMRFGEETERCNTNVATTLHNIGLVHLLKDDFDGSIQVFERALKIHDRLKNEIKIDRIKTLTMLGLSCYAVEDFDDCKKYWREALRLLKKMDKIPDSLIAEVLNNLGCLNFETGNQTSALKCFEESLDMQRATVISDVYDQGKVPRNHMLMRLAITQANIGYVQLRANNANAAIANFMRSMKDYTIILDDHHPFALAVMDHIALAYLKKGDKNHAIATYSKILTAQIMENEGGDNVHCSQTLIKLNMLQAKKKDRKTIRACLKKVKEFIHENNDPCQHQRLEKLLKVSGVVFI